MITSIQNDENKEFGSKIDTDQEFHLKLESDQINRISN